MDHDRDILVWGCVEIWGESISHLDAVWVWPKNIMTNNHTLRTMVTKGTEIIFYGWQGPPTFSNYARREKIQSFQLFFDFSLRLLMHQSWSCIALLKKPSVYSPRTHSILNFFWLENKRQTYFLPIKYSHKRLNSIEKLPIRLKVNTVSCYYLFFLSFLFFFSDT